MVDAMHPINFAQCFVVSLCLFQKTRLFKERGCFYFADFFGAYMKEWLEIATQSGIVKRSLRIAIIVGTLLTLINHYDILFGEPVTMARVVKIMLTYCVPYCVSTFASVSTQLENRKKK